MIRPPRLARWLLISSLPAANRNEIIGDLDEEYRKHVARERSWLFARRLLN